MRIATARFEKSSSHSRLYALFLYLSIFLSLLSASLSFLLSLFFSIIPSIFAFSMSRSKPVHNRGYLVRTTYIFSFSLSFSSSPFLYPLFSLFICTFFANNFNFSTIYSCWLYLCKDRNLHRFLTRHEFWYVFFMFHVFVSGRTLVKLKTAMWAEGTIHLLLGRYNQSRRMKLRVCGPSKFVSFLMSTIGFFFGHRKGARFAFFPFYKKNREHRYSFISFLHNKFYFRLNLISILWLT